MKRAQRIENIDAYYFASKLAEIKQMNQAGLDVINLGIGSPDLSPPKAVLSKLKAVLAQEDLHRYQPYKGIDSLRIAFTNWYQRFYSVDIDSDSEILPLLGSKEGILHISMAFLNEGDLVLVPNPGYPAYQTITKICGAQTVQYELNEENDYLPDIEKLKEIDLDRVKIMWLNYPHMPTGATATVEKFQVLVDLAKANNFLLCHDNPYAYILNQKPICLFEVDKDKEVSIELCSLSKHYNMAGWRIGAVSGSATHIQHILTFKSNMDSGMFKGIQLAAIEALNLGQEWFESQNKIYQERKTEVFKLFDKLDCKYKTDTAGLFVWAKIPDHKNSGEQYSEEILKMYKVFITPGFIFGSGGDRYIRASLCQPKELITKALKRCK